MTKRRTRLAAASMSLVLVAGACTSDDADSRTVDPETADTLVDEIADETIDDSTAALRDDVDCSEEALGSDDTVAFTTAHVIIDGRLGAVCFGESDERITDAWNALAVIAPQGQLADLGLFGGFESTEDGDEVTLAFVNPLDADGTLFQMSVNLASYVDDPGEAQLTMAHELSHVFTALPSQIDRTNEAIDDCSTYFNGEGCYAENSIMYRWITQFWGDGLIDRIDPADEATAEAGQERCAADAGFFGPYAANNPEEDFAEAFSAYVFDIDTINDEQRERIEWIAAQPGLVEFRQRAEAASIESPPNNFAECGLG